MPSIKSKPTQLHSFPFFALGTQWEIVTQKPLIEAVKTTIRDEVERIDGTYSRFRDDSVVSAISHAPGKYQFPDADRVLLEFYDELYEMSQGKVSPLVGDTLVALGYDADYTLRPKSVIPKPKKYPEIVQREEATLTVSEPVTLDFGAAGKGYLVDRITVILIEEGYDTFLVDGSGDMRQVGPGDFGSIGLEHPMRTGEVIGALELHDKALCASATNRRRWGEGLHHVIDPTDGTPVEDIIATWVVADTAMVADGLATALFFCDPNTLAKRYNYAYIRMFANGGVEYSPWFGESLYQEG
jgi:thiamine biosynthesis lipoprotein